MLNVSILLLIVNVIVIIVFAKLNKTIFKIFAYCSLIMLFVGMYTYLLKIGGFSITSKTVIFGLSAISNFLQSRVINFNDLSLIIACGRTFFPIFILLSAINNNYFASSYFSQRKYLYVVVAIPLCIFLYISTKDVFTSLFASDYEKQLVFSYAMLIVIVIYIITALVLNINEYMTINLAIMKKRQGLNVISTVFMLIMYSIFALFEPICVYQNYSTINVKSTFMSFYRFGSVTQWIIIFMLIIISTGISSYATVRYYKFEYDRSRQEMKVKQRISRMSASSTVLIHGVKNQVLTTQILVNRISKEVSNIDNSPHKEKIEILADQLFTESEFIIERFSILHDTMKKSKALLVKTTSTEIMALAKEKIARKQIFCVKYDVENCVMLADTEMLSEVIYNLVVNAFEAVPKSKEPQVNVRLKLLRAKVIIEVEDNGTGIDKTVAKKIFMPFSSSKNSTTNWGLGLSYCLSIVKNHMGEIRYDTKKDVGTTFMVILPKYREISKNG